MHVCVGEWGEQHEDTEKASMGCLTTKQIYNHWAFLFFFLFFFFFNDEKLAKPFKNFPN